MIDGGADVEIINEDMIICTLDDGANLSMELTVDRGKGYVAAAANRPEDAPIGLIPVDSIFSPRAQSLLTKWIMPVLVKSPIMTS